MILLPSWSQDTNTPTGGNPPESARKAEERLGRSGYLALRGISCLASEDELSLHGCLPSYYLKQVAQEIALGVEGVRQVTNRITVLNPSSRRGPGRTIPPDPKVRVELPHQSS